MTEAQRKAQKAYEKALKLHQAGKTAAAEPLYRDILKDFPGQAMVIQNLGIILQDTAQHDEAVALYITGLLHNPDSPQLMAGLAGALGQQGKFPEAIRYAERVSRLQPAAEENWYNLANLYMKNGQNAKALEAFDKAIAKNPELVPAQYNRANLLVNMRQLEQAKSAFLKTIEIAEDFVPGYLNLAMVYMDLGEMEKAAQMLETAEEIDPGYPGTWKHQGLFAHASGDLPLAISYYEKALPDLPEDGEMLLAYGNALRESQQREKALAIFEKLLKIEPENTLARDNRARILRSKIPSWHFEMLADEARNEAYNQALTATARDKIVLDIGTGSGLLAMMAARAGARHVYACEMIKELADAARDIVEANGLSDKITILNKKSTALVIGEDLPEKADLLVSEILDVGVLGEGVLPSVRHAKSMLLKSDAVIIPASAEVFATVVECPELLKWHRVGEVAGFDLGHFNRFQVQSEYTSTPMRKFPEKLLTDITPVGNISLENPPQTVAEYHPIAENFEIPVMQSGQAHAVCFWFTLHWMQGISASSGPDGDLKHWGQAIFYLPETIDLEKGATITLKVLRTDQFYAFEVYPK